MSPVALSTHQCQGSHVSAKTVKSEPVPRSSPVDGVVLTTFPEDSSPIPLKWGAASPEARGPIVASRLRDGLVKHNSIGAHSGSYCVYHALAVGSKQLDPNHIADYTNSQPAFSIPEQKSWYNAHDIVAMDPFGHLTPYLFDEAGRTENVEIRPTIAITKATMQLFEMKDAVANGRLQVDGKVVLNSNGDLSVSKVAVEPTWYLPGVAERFGITEEELRKALFEDTNGMYPELITRPDIKVFLPPIGGLTVYIFGEPSYVSDPTKKLALRVHDECNGSDVFGSDICTCRPYLIFGIEEAVKQAQNGGSGVVVYFRKEGRALGEVTKYLVYNARKRGGDTADEYFHRTECIAGVRDMRFQQLMPDVLKWLGITKIDRMLSMSNMKHDAIVEQGIPIIERIPIPDELVPPDSRVEIDAKINSGYFTTGKIMSQDELKTVQGRAWSDVQ
ncbi:LAQU0S04e08130g1_1 [Lachancea quebecensis]|uniref:LAQU0S04e08130g1_1 n=1 Tax=Lachancea quebecensis TaxID=1654605 RepID=A0A0P1KQW6_9SACH|nr:LAQU0S04e08130g1_1 [Lachancea quebecensis]